MKFKKNIEDTMFKIWFTCYVCTEKWIEESAPKFKWLFLGDEIIGDLPFHTFLHFEIFHIFKFSIMTKPYM